MNVRERFAALSRTVKVDLPEMGTVMLRKLTAREVLELQAARGEETSPAKMGPFMAKMVVLSVLEDDGRTPAFSAADEPTVQDWPADMLRVLVDRIMEVSGMTDRAPEQAEKNSNGKMSASSTA